MKINYTGRRFDRLLVEKMLQPKRLPSGTVGLCRCWCRCGTRITVRTSSLVNGNTRSCGCIRKEQPNRVTHGHTRDRLTTPEYRSWRSMIIRCEDSENSSWPWYGARGIKVCSGWRDSFRKFLADLGPRPGGYSLERKDTDGDYEPSNCHWIPASNQGYNTRTSRRVSAFGRTFCLAEWAEIFGLSARVITDRINKLGWEPHRALTIPVRPLQRSRA